jgi:hypothetical protein
MLRIFVGRDPLQPASTTVLVHSIISRASKLVCVTPLSLKALPIKRRGLTEVTYSRFLAPYLCDYQGWSYPRNDAKLVHFTRGVPFFPGTEGTEYVDEWRSELEASVHAESWESLLGNSVHDKHVRARMAVT